MRLVDLEPAWLARDDDTHFHQVDTMAQADGVLFLCPVCFERHGKSPIGTHAILCWKPTVPQSTSPRPGRWDWQGSGFDDLTLVAGSSSVLLPGEGCGAHFFIRGGEIVLT